MAALSNSISAPGCPGIPPVTVSEPLMPLADLIAAYRAHNDLGTLTSTEIVQMSEDAWGEKETALCDQLAECKPQSLLCVIAALELVAEDGSGDMFGAHHVSMLHNCSDFLSAKA